MKLLLPKIEKLMPPVTKAIGMIDGGIIGVVAENEVKVKEEIDKAFNELAAAVERRRGELLKQLEDAAILLKRLVLRCRRKNSRELPRVSHWPLPQHLVLVLMTTRV